MSETYYQNVLYPFQDRILKVIETSALDFYLTGGTALGRCYLNHRYSDDLDFFVNDHKNFKAQCSTAINALKKRFECDIATTSDSFLRLFIKTEKISIKVDFVNDVPYHFGSIQISPFFHRIDSWRNILSNKICALSRMEAKDIADIVFLAMNYNFDWETIIAEAKQKDLWVDPIQVCQIIDQFPVTALKKIKWIKNVSFENLKRNINRLHKDIFWGNENSMVESGK